MQNTQLNVCVLYNKVTEINNGNNQEILADEDNIVVATDVSNALVELGHTVTMFNVTFKSFDDLKHIKTDLFFNLLENLDNLTNSFTPLLRYIELLGKPITGGSAFSAMLTMDKARTKDFLIKNNLPTPAYQLMINSNGGLSQNLKYPLMTKPNSTDCSLGITQDSVVTNLSELNARILANFKEYADATLVEEFIDGRELDVVGVVTKDGLKVFPIVEAVFNKDKNRKWNICDFDHKWKKSYCENEVCPAQLPVGVTEEITRITKKVADIFSLNGYFRIDLRLSKENVPYIVEVNINPGIDEYVCRSRMKAVGLEYKDFIQMIVDSAFLPK